MTCQGPHGDLRPSREGVPPPTFPRATGQQVGDGIREGDSRSKGEGGRVFKASRFRGGGVLPRPIPQTLDADSLEGRVPACPVIPTARASCSSR